MRGLASGAGIADAGSSERNIKMRTSLPLVLTLLVGVSACSKPAEPPAPASQPPAAPAAAQPANPSNQPANAPAAQPPAGAGAAPSGSQASAAASRPATQEAANPAPQQVPTSAAAAPTAAAPPPPAAPAEPPAPPPPPPPTYKDVTLPAGTQLGLTLHTAVASDTSKVEDPVKATLRRNVLHDELTVLPSGTPLTGSVVAVERSGKV